MENSQYDFYKRTGLKGGAEQVVSNQSASNEVVFNQVISNQVVQKTKIEFKYLLNYEENKTPKINLDNFKLMDFFIQVTL